MAKSWLVPQPHTPIYNAARPSPDSFCQNLCPGCAHRHLLKEASLNQKESFVRQKLGRWPDQIHPITSPSQRTAYRDRVCLNVVEQNRIWSWGMASKEHFFPLTYCPLQTLAINHLLQKMMEALNQGKVSQTEFPLRFIIINGRQIIWVIKSKPQAQVQERMLSLLYAQQAAWQADSDSLWWHWNECCGRRVTAKKTWQKIWGADYDITDTGLKFGPKCFRQVHPTIYAQALAQAANFFFPPGQPGSSIVLVDLFCGIGTSLSFWTKCGLPEENILGVELNGEALQFAQSNFPQAYFLRGTPEQRIPQILPWAKERGGTGAGTEVGVKAEEIYLFVNPPRLGLTTKLRDFILHDLCPTKMIYLSCSPGTLSRDLADLTNPDQQNVKSNYALQVEAIWPFDFFPQTQHVENLVLLKSVGECQKKLNGAKLD
ncbi:MAG: hypothetical protein J6Y94_05495 [Bacteriovoracaceae bacterium]|nr:hypothetical protein [Bacteriovoracaceae bacterium]